MRRGRLKPSAQGRDWPLKQRGITMTAAAGSGSGASGGHCAGDSSGRGDRAGRAHGVPQHHPAAGKSAGDPCHRRLLHDVLSVPLELQGLGLLHEGHVPSLVARDRRNDPREDDLDSGVRHVAIGSNRPVLVSRRVHCLRARRTMCRRIRAAADRIQPLDAGQPPVRAPEAARPRRSVPRVRAPTSVTCGRCLAR